MRYFTHPFQGSIAVLIVAAGMAAAQSPGPKTPATSPSATTMTDPAQSPPLPMPTMPGPAPSPAAPATSPASDAQTVGPSPDANGMSSLPWNYSMVDYKNHMWFEAGYLLEWFKHSPVPVPLVTAGSVSDVQPGALGQPHTLAVLGNSSVGSGALSGMQFTAGAWLNRDDTFGVELNYFLLPKVVTRQNVSSTGQPGSASLAVPFFDVSGTGTTTGRPGETVFVAAGPRLASNGSVVPGTVGSFAEIVKTDLQGGGFDFIHNLSQNGGLRVDLTAGFRWLRLVNELDFTAQTAGVNPQLVGQFFDSVDKFQAVNSFYGGRMGGRIEYRSGAWTFDSTTNVGLGGMVEQVQVTGLSDSASTGPIRGGIFAQPSSVGNPGNIGRHIKDHFAATVDETLTVGYQPCSWLRLFGGYNLLYISSVAQPGDQIDHNINSTLTGIAATSRGQGNGPAVTGPPTPAFMFHDSSFWAQGFTLGFEIRY